MDILPFSLHFNRFFPLSSMHNKDISNARLFAQVFLISYSSTALSTVCMLTTKTEYLKPCKISFDMFGSPHVCLDLKCQRSLVTEITYRLPFEIYLAGISCHLSN